MYAIKARGFPVCYLFCVALSPSAYVHPRAFFEHSQLCFQVVYSFGFFYYDLSVPIFCSKIFLLLSHPVLDMASTILPLIVGRIFFRCFGTSCFVYIVWPCLGIILVFLLSLVFFGWSPQAFFFFRSTCRDFSISSENFLMFRFRILVCGRSHFYLLFKFEFPPRFWHCTCGLQGDPVY